MHSEISAMDECTTHCNNYSLVITCEHGGNRIPSLYRDLFKANQALLDSHRGFDPGAINMAKDLAAAFAAPLVAATVSRLLVDLNRSVRHPHLHYETIRKLPSELRDIILKQYYQPYRTQAEHLVRQAIAEYGQVIHLSSHSFTPELNGKVRNADIGLLYDPARPYEIALCEQWKLALKAYAPELSVRRNYPYEGKGDGLTSWFRQRLPQDKYIGIELEVNQKHIFKAGRHWPALRKVIVKSLCLALSKLGQNFPLRPIQTQ
ncbi:N-formylglutamate amidohydrolase [Crenothrix polyspora]|uniref:N-formylglutamate amidohydrolase n=1 Tax=Crenothrix polyspora TaxID=360316 RepID=A0A1R4HH98_9GAMM